MRIGYGWDSHEFKRGVALRIGGVELPHDRGLSGHSDGDVLLHALTDALLGAVAAGDIGGYFPPSDPRWKGADSAVFVAEALRQVARAGYRVANVDSTLVLAEPRIGPHAPAIQKRVAALLGIPVNAVGIKAKTPEGMGTDNAARACSPTAANPRSMRRDVKGAGRKSCRDRSSGSDTISPPCNAAPAATPSGVIVSRRAINPSEPMPAVTKVR